MEGAVVKFTIPVMVENVCGIKLVAEAEDAVGSQFGGVKIKVESFEGSELLKREVFWKAFDGEAGKITGHSMGFWRQVWRVLICTGRAAD